MINEWNKFKGWCVLQHFLLFPNSKIHINALARKINIGPNTAQRFCRIYFTDGLLKKEEIGNVHLYSINNTDARIVALKKFIGPYIVSDRLHSFISSNKSVLSIALYGSYASGDYHETSDVDLLILTSDDTLLDTAEIKKHIFALGKDFNPTILSISKWRAMEKNKNAFFISIQKNNILLWGNAL